MTTQQAPDSSLNLADVASFATVQQWVQAYGSHWNPRQSEADARRRLEVLRRFCEFCGKDPDALVRSLFRDTPQGTRIRLKRRREVMAQIDAFEAMVAEGDVRRGREMANIVRSFLIHNGVALTATPLR
jgi:hypothetical protein